MANHFSILALSHALSSHFILNILLDHSCYWVLLSLALLRSPWYFMRHPILAPQLEKTHETPPSSRDEGLLFLHGLESNPESSIQTPQEA